MSRAIHPPLAGRDTEHHAASGGGEQPGELAELAHVQPYGTAPGSAGPTHRLCGFLMRPHHVLMTGHLGTRQLFTRLLQKDE